MYDEWNYEGNFKSDQRHGKGVLTTSKGFFYEGDWVDDYKEGYGVWK